MVTCDAPNHLLKADFSSDSTCMSSYAMSPQSALVRTWLRLLRTIIDGEASLVHVRAMQASSQHAP
jgi:hypothetical protein